MNYQIQAQEQGFRKSELNISAINSYADKNFKHNRSLQDIDFSKTVTLKKEATDFLLDDEYKYL